MGDIRKGTCKVVVEDAVYLILETPPDAVPADKLDIMKLIESSGVIDIDISAILNALKEPLPYKKIKISSNTNLNVSDEKVTVNVSKDRMEASVVFEKPSMGGKLLTPELIVKSIEAAGIRYGLNKRLIQALVQKRDYNNAYTIAVGRKPVDGVAGSLDYRFDLNPKTNKPKILDDGRVDFRQIEYIESVLTGQTLAVVIPPTPGTDGVNVLGEPIPAKPGKPAPKLFKGKNTCLSPDEMSLYAEVSGHLIFKNNRIEVSPVLEIRLDVDLSTGHVDFAGDVIVRGNVKSGFTVRATGSIDVYGTVEGAVIDAGDDINLYSGVQGMERATIKSGKDLFMRYAENASRINVVGDITADSIMHSNVQCGGNLKLEGRKCVLVGGKIDVAKSINARIIGSSMSTVTDISAGNHPENLDKFTALKAELAIATETYEKNDKASAILLKNTDIQKLPPEKKEILIKIMHAKAFYRERIQALQTEMADLASQLATSNGEISASERIYAGTKVLIGNALMHVREDMEGCTLKNIEGKIMVCSYEGAARARK